MATQNHTVTNHSCALNVVDLITVKIAKKVKKHQQNAHYAEAIILPTTKVVNISINLIKGNNTFRNNRQHTPPVYTNIFISLSRTSELGCATTKTDTAERSISISREPLQVFCVLCTMVHLQVSPLGGSRDETLRGQGIRKRSVSWNLPKLSQL